MPLRKTNLPFRTMRDGREICSKTRQGLALYRSRTLAMANRQNWRCALCGRPMTANDVSFDHQNGRGHGGAWRDDRIDIEVEQLNAEGIVVIVIVKQNAAVHILCNGEKGSRRIPYLLQ